VRLEVTVDRACYNIKEVCEYLGISRNTAYNLVYRNEIPYFKIGAKILFSKSRLDEWIQEKSGERK
jgi:excisionase family DNA binding protein